MGWREVIASTATAAIAWNDEGDLEVNADTLREKLDAMPTPDRIALARELLAGTGRVVARAPEQPTEAFREAIGDYVTGWSGLADVWPQVCAAMLADDVVDE